MPRGKPSITVDTAEVEVLTGTLKGLHREFNTDRHLSAVTRAAFEVANEHFTDETHRAAAMAPTKFHHVYEWKHIGHPGFQLYRNKMTGRGGMRSVTWEWRASKTLVPTDVNIDGTRKFPQGFDTSKLNKIHIFVWKAPMMEYGVEVTVRPKLATKLVFPNPELLGSEYRKRGASNVTFTPHFVRFTPGGEVMGHFTLWFTGWWGGGMAQEIIDSQFTNSRDRLFKHTFQMRMARTPKGRMRRKSFTIVPDASSARYGKNIARAMAADMEHNYIAMAARRRRRSDLI